ncbi:zinc-ribbon domain-containing protein [Fibrobacter intestinalis]|uniref:Zinc-ribbon domain-containing protein n=1 Tax=Fibrobacter intestinalis TaxID=28122 RepID=A0A1T4MES3_9BACT|nr:zinc ribbon protein [Fibrobacter sp. NR9]SJZ65367.1 zinc-ribbon domain-containing protein [Fibrobacter intestinalis]
MFCKHCGGQISENTKFCSKCGASVAEELPNFQQNPVNPPNLSNSRNTANTSIVKWIVIGIISIFVLGFIFDVVILGMVASDTDKMMKEADQLYDKATKDYDKAMRDIDRQINSIRF